MRLLDLVWFWLLLGCVAAGAESFTALDSTDNEIEVDVLPAQGELLTIFLVDQDQGWSGFETIARAMVVAGVEVWTVDLLKAYFLPQLVSSRPQGPNTLDCQQRHCLGPA